MEKPTLQGRRPSRGRLAWLAAAVLAFPATAALMANDATAQIPCTTQVFDIRTGVTDGAPAPDPDGTPDDTWTLILAPATATGPAQSIGPSSAWTARTPLANWIGASNGNTSSAPAGDYIYETTFDLPLFAFNTVIAFDYAVDNTVEFYLNALPIGGYPSIDTGAFRQFHQVSWAGNAGNGFIHGGTNVLQAHVDNGSGPTGLIINGTIESCQFPPVCGDTGSNTVAEAFNVHVEAFGFPLVDKLNLQRAAVGSSNGNTLVPVTTDTTVFTVRAILDGGFLHSEAAANANENRALSRVHGFRLLVDPDTTDSSPPTTILEGDLIQAESHTNTTIPSSNDGDSRVVGLAVLGGPPQTYAPTPNTVVVNTGGIRVMLNEQSGTTGGGASTLEVNMIHVWLYASQLKVMEIIVSHAFSSCGEVTPPEECHLEDVLDAGGQVNPPNGNDGYGEVDCILPCSLRVDAEVDLLPPAAGEEVTTDCPPRCVWTLLPREVRTLFGDLWGLLPLQDLIYIKCTIEI